MRNAQTIENLAIATSMLALLVVCACGPGAPASSQAKSSTRTHLAEGNSANPPANSNGTDAGPGQDMGDTRPPPPPKRVPLELVLVKPPELSTPLEPLKSPHHCLLRKGTKVAELLALQERHRQRAVLQALWTDGLVPLPLDRGPDVAPSGKNSKTNPRALPPGYIHVGNRRPRGPDFGRVKPLFAVNKHGEVYTLEVHHEATSIATIPLCKPKGKQCRPRDCGPLPSGVHPGHATVPILYGPLPKGHVYRGHRVVKVAWQGFELTGTLPLCAPIPCPAPPPSMRRRASNR